MHQNRFLLMGLCPRPRRGSLQRSPRHPCWIKGVLLLREGKEGSEGKGRRKGKRLSSPRKKRRHYTVIYAKDIVSAFSANVFCHAHGRPPIVLVYYIRFGILVGAAKYILNPFELVYACSPILFRGNPCFEIRTG